MRSEPKRTTKTWGVSHKQTDERTNERTKHNVDAEYGDPVLESQEDGEGAGGT